MWKNKQIRYLILLTLIGGLLRFWKLSDFPVSLNWDEVSHGYNAYSILLTGKDEWGKTFPLIFRAFGDYKLPVYIYLTVIPIWIFGLNAFAVRFISALAGTLAIPGIYLLANILFPDFKIFFGKFRLKIGDIAAFILVFSPWHFFISRPALEANLSLTLIIFGFYFLIRFYESRSSLLPSALLLGLSLHTYNTARIFVPTLALVSLLIYRPSFKKVLGFSNKSWFLLKNISAVILVAILSGIVVFQVYIGEGTARYEKLKILSPATVFQIGEKRAQSNLSPLISKLIYNRPIYFFSIFTKNYLSYFSPDFYTQKWGAQFQFAIPGKSLLTLPIYLLSFLGFFAYLRRTKEDKSFQFLYAWLLLSPVAASLTIDPPQALRPNPMIPALVLLACFGLTRFLFIIPENIRKCLTVGIAVWTIILFGVFVYNYTTDYKIKYSSSWQYGYQEIMQFVQDHHAEYDHIFITKRYGEPHIFYSFYNKLSPELVQNGMGNIRFEKSDWFWTDAIDRVYFVNDWQIPTTSIKELPLEFGINISTAHSLLITSPDHVPVNAHIIKTVNFLDGSPAFIITSVP